MSVINFRFRQHELYLIFFLHLVLLVPAPLVYLRLRKSSYLRDFSTRFFRPIWIYQQLLFHEPYFLWTLSVSPSLHFLIIFIILLTRQNHTRLILWCLKMANLFLIKKLLVWLWFSLSINIIIESFNHFNLVFHLYLKLFTLSRRIKCLLLNIVILLLVCVTFNVIYVFSWRKLVFNIYIAWSVYSVGCTLLEFPFLYTCKVHVYLIT